MSEDQDGEWIKNLERLEERKFNKEYESAQYKPKKKRKSKLGDRM